MPATSEARISANRQNSAKSTGPKTPAGKEKSRQNGLKHGLTGSGVVLAERDASEVERRAGALMSELDPQSTLGRVLVGQIATLSVRMERGARQEEEATASRVRHAAEVFDRDRFDRAEQLFESLAESPRDCLRELRRSPEGVDRLTLAWSELRDDLTREPRPSWSGPHFDKVANLVGLRPDDIRASGLRALSQSTWGYFAGLTAEQGAGLDVEARKVWARDRLVERIDEEIAGLEAHRATLDLETIELDRAGAADIALFDPSREATLARRYEAEARRGFFKALKDLRQVEAEAADRPASPPIAKSEPESLGSSWVGPSPTLRQPKPSTDELPDWSFERDEAVARGLDGRILAVGRGVAEPR